MPIPTRETIPVDPLMPTRVDCETLDVRSINQAIHAAIAAGELHIELVNSYGQHNLAVGLTQPVRITIDGSVGYYCGGMMDGATIEVNGSAGWGTTESILSGTMIVKGHAGSGTAASIRGGLVVVHGDAAARAGVSMKGGTLVIGGNCGYMTGFMMQKGRIIVCGNAGEALGDSMYEGVIYVGGTIGDLGNDAIIVDLTGDEIAEIGALLDQYQVKAPPMFRKVVAGRRLWNFDRKDLDIWKVAL